MAENLIGSQAILASPTPGTPNAQYLAMLVEQIRHELSFLRTHINDHMQMGTAAERPPADGTRRFFWVTDGTPHLEFDSGTWTSV